MDDSIALDDLLLELLYLRLVHRLDLIVSLKIRLLEMLELPLQLLELASYSLVVRCQLLIRVFELLVFFLVLCPQIAISSIEQALLLLELLVVLMVLLLLLFQDFEVIV